MPVVEVQGDLLASDCTVIGHGCNCFCTMGSGIAKAIKDKYPEAYQADLDSIKGSETKLGSISVTKVKYPLDLCMIVNMYTQYEYGTHKRQINYEAIYTSLEAFKEVTNEITTKDGLVKVGLPRIGTGLGGGNWRIIKTMIEEIFHDKTVYIYSL